MDSVQRMYTTNQTTIVKTLQYYKLLLLLLLLLDTLPAKRKQKLKNLSKKGDQQEDGNGINEKVQQKNWTKDGKKLSKLRACANSLPHDIRNQKRIIFKNPTLRNGDLKIVLN